MFKWFILYPLFVFGTNVKFTMADSSVPNMTMGDESLTNKNKTLVHHIFEYDFDQDEFFDHIPAFLWSIGGVILIMIVGCFGFCVVCPSQNLMWAPVILCCVICDPRTVFNKDQKGEVLAIGQPLQEVSVENPSQESQHGPPPPYSEEATTP